MTSRAPAAAREFPAYRRGTLRDLTMTLWRNYLRELTNPDTGEPFGEDEIAAAAAQQSRWWIQADIDDQVLLGVQQRGIFLADQHDPRKAATTFLEVHGELLENPRLPAAGGAGLAEATAAPGETFVGSTTVPDPIASTFRAPDQTRYQVLYNATVPLNGDPVEVQLQAIDTGAATNLAAGTPLTPDQNKPVGATEPATVTTAFVGGRARETDAEWGQRLADDLAAKQGAGNPAELRGWAREASASVQDAFIYSCALHAGTVVIVPLAKRTTTGQGPLARIPSLALLTLLTDLLTPPGSPKVPTPPHVLVVPPTGTYSNTVSLLELPVGDESGYTDLVPWPESVSGGSATITGSPTQTAFELTRESGSADLPTGVTAPALMVWDRDTSLFYSLDVQSVVPSGGDTFDVTLSTPAPVTLANGMYVSPDTEQRETIALAIEAYFDSLGPGEIIDLTTDDRAHRAARDPEPSTTAPARAGASILLFLEEALQASLGDRALLSISLQNPAIPSDPVDGPRLVVCGHVAITAPAT